MGQLVMDDQRGAPRKDPLAQPDSLCRAPYRAVDTGPNALSFPDSRVPQCRSAGVDVFSQSRQELWIAAQAMRFHRVFDYRITFSIIRRRAASTD
jgi:hypothetical protein